MMMPPSFAYMLLMPAVFRIYEPAKDTFSMIMSLTHSAFSGLLQNEL